MSLAVGTIPDVPRTRRAHEGRVEMVGNPFQCWCGWIDSVTQMSTHAEYADNVELQFGERGYPPHEPSENWNLPEPDEEVPVTHAQGVLRVVALDSAHGDPDFFEYPDDNRKHADEPVWGVWEHDGSEWSEVESGLTLREAEGS
jgi:hypothetical protein